MVLESVCAYHSNRASTSLLTLYVREPLRKVPALMLPFVLMFIVSVWLFRASWVLTWSLLKHIVHMKFNVWRV